MSSAMGVSCRTRAQGMGVQLDGVECMEGA